MATGDIKNNIRKLISELKQVKHEYQKINYDSLTHGNPAAFLPIIHYVFIDYSHEFASYLASKGYDFCGKTDLRFMETIYKFLMQDFSYKPCLTKDQFLALGFAERKIIVLTDIVKFARKKHEVLCKKKKKTVVVKRAQIVSKDGYLDSTANSEIKDASHAAVIEHSPRKEKPTALKHTMSQKFENVNNRAAPAVAKHDTTKTSSRGRTRHARPLSANSQPNTVPENHKSQNVPLLVPEAQAQLPRPCSSLMVTPLKDDFLDQSKDESVLNIQSEALPMDIPDEPLAFKVTKHDQIVTGKKAMKIQSGRVPVNRPLAFQKNLEQDKGNGSIPEESGSMPENFTDMYSGNHKPLCINPSHNNEVLKISETCDTSILTEIPPDHAICNEPRCKKSVKLLDDLQTQVGDLTASVHDLVMINDDLSARVVLLETKNKLLEEKFESLDQNFQQSNEVAGDFYKNRFSDGKESISVEIGPNHTAKNVPKSKKRVDFILHSEEENLVSYSPEKYTDDDNPLPLDFQPIQIEQLVSDQELSDDVSSPDIQEPNTKFDCVTKHGEVNCVTNNPEAESFHLTKDADKGPPLLSKHKLELETAVLSPLKNPDFSFMEQGTKDAVLNVQQRLEETMNLLKKSTSAFTAKDKKDIDN